MTRQGNVSILIKARDATQAALASVNAKLTRFGKGVSAALGVATRALGALGLGVGGVSAALLPFIVKATMEFQKFSAQIRIFTGSATGATRVMNDLKRLAIDLPFDLAQITEAFVTLRAGGIDPSEETMRRLGDIASGMGKDILQLAQAVKQGTMGEMEMLKQFGFAMRVEGDQLRASFGKHSKAIGRDAGSILGFLEEIAQAEFAGAAAARMATLEGAFSNLQDKAWALAVMVGEKGGVAAAIGELAGQVDVLLVKISENEDAVVKWTGVFIDSVKLIGSALWTALVVPWNVIQAGFRGTAALVLQLAAGLMEPLYRMVNAAAELTGSTTLAGVASKMDPLAQWEAAADLAEQARNDLRTAGEQVGQFVQRGVDVAVAATAAGARGRVGLGSGMAGTTTTPNNGQGGTGGETIAEMLKREQKLDAARGKREGAGGDGFTETIGLTNAVNRGAGLDKMSGLGLPEMAELNASIQATLASLKDLQITGPTAMEQFGAALVLTADAGWTLEQQLIDIGTRGIHTFVDGMLGAFSQLREGWAAVGQAMVQAVRGAVAQMAMDQARYYGTKAIAALGEALLNPLSAGKSLAAAAKFTAAAAGFAALSGLAQGGGGGGGRGGGGRGGFGVGIGGPLDDRRASPVTVIMPNSGVINVNDPRTQDEFRAMLEKLSGRAVEIRRR